MDWLLFFLKLKPQKNSKNMIQEKNKNRRKWIVAIAIVVSSFASAYGSSSPDEVYVSPKGNDTNTGTLSSPVKTLGRAVAVLAEKYKRAAFGEAIIWLNSGIYSQLNTVEINPELFGGKQVRITIASKEKGKVQLSGGHQIPSNLFKKVADPALLQRLHANAAGKIFAADLKGTGLEEAFIQNLDDQSAWDARKANFSFVSWGAHLLKLAQWPNRGYAHIGEVLDIGPTTRMLKPGELPKEYSRENPTGAKFKTLEQTDWSKWDNEFAYSGDVVLEGYTHNDWYFQVERVGNLKDGLIQLLHHTRYGVVNNPKLIPRRVRFVNLLSELDEPGEWYFDHRTKAFFVYPIAPITATMQLSVLGGETMLSAQGLNHFTIKNIVFENGGDLAVELDSCNNSLLAGCTFRNFQGRGFSIKGGKKNGVTGCDFYGLHSAGTLSGGNRKTLEPAGHYMVNNEIYDCRLRGYGAVGLSGVGIQFAHNVMHDMNGAVSFSGSELIIEYNEFYNMGWEMGDWNVVYIGADWASWGNEVRYNFVHHLMEMPGAYPVEGFRNDDLGMGVNFHGNIFYKSGRGSIAFSGAGNVCKNNIAIETPTVWQAHLPAMGAKEIQQKWEELKPYDNGELKRGDKGDFLWRAEQIVGKMGWLFEPYVSKYPTLKKIMNDGNPWAPSFAEINHNYVSRQDTAKGFYTHRGSIDAMPATALWEFPFKIDVNKAFVDPSTLNFKLKKDFRLVKGFEPIDFEKIGLYTDQYRASVPDKDQYRKKIKDRFEGIQSSGGRYDVKEAYKIYPPATYSK
jgi:Right handed beta helix region